MIRSLLLLSLVITLFSTYVINEVHAQELAPGKLIQIRQDPEYPFGLLGLDSLIGREYILLSPIWPPPKSSNYTLLTSEIDSLFLMSINQPDSLFRPWIGSRFRILQFEPAPAEGNPLNDLLLLLIRFNDGPTMVLRVPRIDLLGGGSQLIPASVLDSARRRWVGKYLWTNVKSSIPNIRALTPVKILSIDPSLDWSGHYAFRIVSVKGDTATVNCKLQLDSSLFGLHIGTAFRKLFLDGNPALFYKTIPDSGLDHDEIFLGEDRTTFFKKIKRLGVRTQSSNVKLSMSGFDSLETVELRGKGIWGMPFDSCSASFVSSKLHGLSFTIYDSANEISIVSDLIKRFGDPSIADTSHGLSQMVMKTWLFYSPQRQLRQIILMDDGSAFSASGTLTKAFPQDTPVRMNRAKLFYCDEEGKYIQIATLQREF